MQVFEKRKEIIQYDESIKLIEKNAKQIKGNIEDKVDFFIKLNDILCKILILLLII